MRRPLPSRRRCSDRHAASVCATALGRRCSPTHAMLDIRIRDSCRLRTDFTGRGFGRERQRQAR